MARQPNDAWRAGLHHFHRRAAAEAQFMESMDLVRTSHNLMHFCDLTGTQGAKGDYICHGTLLPLKASIATETQSHLGLILSECRSRIN
jgi:hypothetical protein